MYSRASTPPRKKRNHASVACSACRRQRTKCITGRGQSGCDNCMRRGEPCVVRDIDLRRRRITKAGVDTLMSRVGTLEKMLTEMGVELPSKVSVDDVPGSISTAQQSVPRNPAISEQAADTSANLQRSAQTSRGSWQGPKPARTTLPSPPVSSVSSTSLRVEEAQQRSRDSGAGGEQSGVLPRYFGMTTNYHIFSDWFHSSGPAQHTLKSADMRATRLLDSIPAETAEYLLNIFWECYNKVVPVVHQEAFELEKDTKHGRYYSGLLHLTMLGVGYRYADRSRHGVQRLAGPGKESLMHKEAKCLVDQELKMPGGIPSIQAMLLMGDLECGVGNYNTGWLYAGMASRLCFDLGLNRGDAEVEHMTLEARVKKTVLWACVLLDRYWGLFLGRPTAIKLADLSNMNTEQPLRGCQPMGSDKRAEIEVYEALIKLMEVSVRLTDTDDRDYLMRDPGALYRVAGIDHELRQWHARLPYSLKMCRENLETMPPSFLLLQLQYHTMFILLYRPYMYETKYMPPTGTDYLSQPNLGFVPETARKTCFCHAVQVARIFRLYSERFNIRMMFVTGMQHAATSAIALVDGMSTVTSLQEQSEALLDIQCLAEALNAHAVTYVPAEVMSRMLFDMIGRFRANQLMLRDQAPVGEDDQEVNGQGSGVRDALACSAQPSVGTPLEQSLQFSNHTHRSQPAGGSGGTFEPSVGTPTGASLDSQNTLWPPRQNMAPVSPQWFTGTGADAGPPILPDFDDSQWDAILDTLSQPLNI